MRLPTLISVVVIAVLIARLARRWWGDIEAIWAPAIFLTFAMVTEIGGRLQIDPLLSALCVVALYIEARPAPTVRERVSNIRMAAVWVGVAGLAKGPIAIVNVGLVIATWEWIRPRSEIARAPWTVWLQAFGLAVIPSVVWALLAALQEPDLLKSLFFEEHVGRLARSDRHPGRPWKNLLRMPLLLLPWTALVVEQLVQLVRNRRGSSSTSRDNGAWMAAAWMSVLFVFYSLIPTKRDLYLLPAYPAAALLAARLLGQAIRRKNMSAWSGLTGPLVLMLVAAGLIAAPIATDEMPDLTARAPFIGVPMLVGAVTAIVLYSKRRIRRWALAVAATWFCFAFLAAALLFPPLNTVKSTRNLALEIAALPQKPPEVPCLGDVRPDGFRFYAGVPTVRDNDEATRDRVFLEALDRDGPQFLGLITVRRLEKIPTADRRKMRQLFSRKVGDKDIVVVTAAD